MGGEAPRPIKFSAQRLCSQSKIANELRFLPLRGNSKYFARAKSPSRECFCYGSIMGAEPALVIFYCGSVMGGEAPLPIKFSDFAENLALDYSKKPALVIIFSDCDCTLLW